MSGALINPFMVAPSVVGTTWNPADKATNIALSNGDLTATQASVNATWCAVRGIASAASGKRYFEAVFAGDDGSQGYFMVGVGKAAAGLNSSFVGSDANGWGWQPGQRKRWTNNASVAYGPGLPVSTSGVIGILLDITGGTLEFLFDNASQGTAYSSLSGTFFPMCAVVSGVQTGVVTARFTPAQWSYTPPAGYSEWS